MRELTYYVAVTLDGFIAGPDEETEFFPLSEDYAAFMASEYPETLPTHGREQLGVAGVPNRHFDTVLMGRHTYDFGATAGFTNPYGHLRQFVVSTTLDSPPDPAVQLIADNPREQVRKLKAEDSSLGIWLCGGGRLAGTLLDEIDRLIVKKYPVLAGSGIPAVSAAFGPTAYTLTDCQTFDNGCAVLSYRRDRAA